MIHKPVSPHLFALIAALTFMLSWQAPVAIDAQRANTLSASLPTTVFAVTTGNDLLRFDGAAPGTILSTVAITGLQASETVLGIDFRPATGRLYALGSANRLYTLDIATGAATPVTTTASFTLTGTAFGFDFNPVADRIRVVSDAEQNIRLNPTTGLLSGTDSNLNPVGNVVGAAYDRNFAGAPLTTLFGIDSGSNMLVRQGGVDGVPPSPNTGVITNIGSLGVNTSSLVGFDIARDGEAYASLTVGSSSQLYTITLTTGAATLVGSIGSGQTIRDIAVAPTYRLFLPVIVK